MFPSSSFPLRFSRLFLSADRPLILNIPHWVSRNPVELYLIMKMRTWGLSGIPNLSQFIAPFHLLSDANRHFTEVAVTGRHPKSMGDRHHLSMNPIRSSVRNNPIRWGNYRCSHTIRNIETFVHLC